MRVFSQPNATVILSQAKDLDRVGRARCVGPASTVMAVQTSSGSFARKSALRMTLA